MDLASKLEAFADIAKAKAFLGREFLTWLWYTAEAQTEALSLNVDGASVDVRLWIDDHLVLEGTDAGTHALRGGRPGQSPEAAVALRTGKSVSDVRVGIDIGGWGAFTATLDHRDLMPRTLKLPVDDPDQMQDAASDEEPLERRLHLTGIFLATLDALFREYLDLRLRESWPEDGFKPIRAWIQERYQETAAVYH